MIELVILIQMIFRKRERFWQYQLGSFLPFYLAG